MNQNISHLKIKKTKIISALAHADCYVYNSDEYVGVVWTECLLKLLELFVSDGGGEAGPFSSSVPHGTYGLETGNGNLWSQTKFTGPKGEVGRSASTH